MAPIGRAVLDLELDGVTAPLVPETLELLGWISATSIRGNFVKASSPFDAIVEDFAAAM
jgi:hypothetical protein